MKRKVLAIFLAGCVAFTAIPMDVYASETPVVEESVETEESVVTYAVGEEKTFGDYTYTVLDNNTISITKYQGSETDVTIPSVIDEKKVTVIGDEAFDQKDALVSVTIPDSVTHIGKYAFANCGKLANVELPNKLEIIGTNAFYGCDSLTDINIPKSLTTVNGGAFTESGITNVTFEEGITTIVDDLFFLCTKLETVEIPETVTEIGSYAFSFCGKLKAVYIPCTVRTFENDIFYDSENVTIYSCSGSAAKRYASENDIAFKACKHSFPIEKAVVTLSDTSFVYDGKAKKPAVTVRFSGVKLTKGTDYTVSYANNIAAGTAKVTIKGAGCFVGNVSENYTITPASVKGAKVTLAKTSYSYNGKAKKPGVTVMVGDVKLVKGTDYTVSYKNNKNIGTATVTITGKGNYKDKISKTYTIKAEKGTTFTSGKYKYKVTGSSTVAFNGIASKKTTKVTIPKTVKYGGKTFKVTSVADKALKGKTKVTQVTIGANVKTIGVSAFEGCKKLSKVTYGSAVTTIDDNAFKNCTALTSVTIPSKVTKIDKQAFYGCKSLKTITIKSTKLKTVGKEAFKKINEKATIKVPKSKLSSYKKLLEGKGQGSKVKIKKYN